MTGIAQALKTGTAIITATTIEGKRAACQIEGSCPGHVFGIVAKRAEQETDGIPYEIVVTDAPSLSNNTTLWSGEYVVSSDLTINSHATGTTNRVKLAGNTTLTINTGVTLTVPWGIYVPEGNTLTSRAAAR